MIPMPRTTKAKSSTTHSRRAESLEIPALEGVSGGAPNQGRSRRVPVHATSSTGGIGGLTPYLPQPGKNRRAPPHHATSSSGSLGGVIAYVNGHPPSKNR